MSEQQPAPAQSQGNEQLTAIAEQLRAAMDSLAEFKATLATLDKKTDSNAKAIDGIVSAVQDIQRDGVPVKL